MHIDMRFAAILFNKFKEERIVEVLLHDMY